MPQTQQVICPKRLRTLSKPKAEMNVDIFLAKLGQILSFAFRTVKVV